MLESLLKYAPIFPEVVLAIGAMALLLLGTLNNENTGEPVTWGAMILMAIAAVIVAFHPMADTVRLFDGVFTLDGFAKFAKILVLVASIVTLFMSINEMKRLGELQFEYPVLIVFATLGMLVMVSATDLITLYLGLEIQSLALYVCAALRRDSTRSSEAGLKYFVLGALSSGMLLYGASLIYGYTGSTLFSEIATAIKADDVPLGLIFGLVFLLAGFAFKISAVPFHMWTPDVYEGAPTPITAFFAGAPKVAAMAMLTRVVVSAFPEITSQWQQILVFIAIASMVLGAFAAIGQTNIKRLMAYSSIGHMGFALVGLAAGTPEGVQGVLIYLAIYVLTTLGVFACIMAMRKSDGPVEEIDQLAGLSQTNLPMAVALLILFFSLAGIPPVAGFFAKFFVFAPAIKAGLYPLAIIGVLASVVGAFYYLRVIKVMFFDDPDEAFEPMHRSLGSVIAVTSVLIAVFALPLMPLWNVAEAAAKSLF